MADHGYWNRQLLQNTSINVCKIITHVAYINNMFSIKWPAIGSTYLLYTFFLVGYILVYTNFTYTCIHIFNELVLNLKVERGRSKVNSLDLAVALMCMSIFILVYACTSPCAHDMK